jgi:uncharacterized protein (TIGR04255 family)
MRVPKRISPAPLAEAIAEFRFEVSVPSSVFLGQVYQDLIKEFPQFEELPTAALFKQVKDADPAFKNAPHYRFIGKKRIVL